MSPTSTKTTMAATPDNKTTRRQTALCAQFSGLKKSFFSPVSFFFG